MVEDSLMMKCTKFSFGVIFLPHVNFAQSELRKYAPTDEMMTNSYIYVDPYTYVSGKQVLWGCGFLITNELLPSNK